MGKTTDGLPAETKGMVPLASIRAGANYRKTFDPAGLEALAESIKAHGVLKPLIVRPVGPNVAWVNGKWTGVDHFQLVDGERRFRAAKIRAARVVCRFYDHELIRDLYPEPAWEWRRLTGRKQTNEAAPEVLLINRPGA